MATGTTNAIPTWGETTDYADTIVKNYKFDNSYIHTPLYIESFSTSFAYSSGWSGGLFYSDYGRSIGGCIMFVSTHTTGLTSDQNFVTVKFSVPLSAYWKNKSFAGTGTLMNLTTNTNVTQSYGIKVSVDAYGTGATIGFQYRGNQWTFTNTHKYSITWQF